MRWTPRLKAAEQGIWKSTEMRRWLADAGLEVSAGKMSALWTGSTEDYYTNGRCRRCHRSAQAVGSCLDCLAWGVTRHFGWLCEACLA